MYIERHTHARATGIVSVRSCALGLRSGSGADAVIYRFADGLFANSRDGHGVFGKCTCAYITSPGIRNLLRLRAGLPQEVM